MAEHEEFGSLTTAGYSNKGCEEFLQQALRVNRRAMIVDTRNSPTRQWSSFWMRRGLGERYHERYVWRGDLLGNINHARRHLPIQLKDEQRGLAWIVRQGQTLILLCGCADVARCHRKVIYDKVCARLPGLVSEYRPGSRVSTPYGLGLIDPDIPLEVSQARNRYAVIHDTWTPHRYLPPSAIETYEDPELLALLS
ncbi:DUF488 family protein [Ktedonospora formicarum]|uniref:DUF488 domain-containing protein n=1 Tax=Ktedonospora formicarum TaxID=2778364 RepID=A0A8J3IEL7_9CHLR|nr:DUF488 family protein [Ktedonospora formicarum]GHO50958.1 hypothetical protein KSX_91210 [Ktedonospora formicarum]